MNIIVNKKKVIRAIVIIVVTLSLLSLLGQFYKYLIMDGNDRYLVRFFNLDDEYNLPTLYAFLSLLLCGILILIIAVFNKKARKPFSLHWTMLSVIFFLIAIDEILVLHEQVSGLLSTVFHTSGILYFLWVVPAGIFVILFLIFYARFIFGLPTKSRISFVLAGGIYVIGALGFEFIGGGLHTSIGDQNLTYGLVTNVEEIFEMVGIAIFIYALLDYININIKETVFSFKDK